MKVGKVSKNKLSMADINKNSSIEIDHTIRKIKEREFKLTVLWVFIFLISLIVSTLIVGFSFKSISDYNKVESNNLVIEFGSHDNVLDDIITLDNNSVLNYEDGLISKSYKFRITNQSDHKINYVIKLVDDYTMIEYDECYGMLFDKKNMFFSLNNKVIGLVSDLYNGSDYVILEESLRAKKFKDFEFRIWVDKNYINNGHYHGKIVIEEVEGD